MFNVYDSGCKDTHFFRFTFVYFYQKVVKNYLNA